MDLRTVCKDVPVGGTQIKRAFTGEANDSAAFAPFANIEPHLVNCCTTEDNMNKLVN